MKQLILPGIHMNRVVELTLPLMTEPVPSLPVTPFMILATGTPRRCLGNRKERNELLLAVSGKVDGEVSQLDLSGAHNVMAHGQQRQTNTSTCPGFAAY